MPVVRLTAQVLRTLPAIDGKRTSYRDALMKGLVLVVSPTGSRVWYAIYKRHRRNRPYKLGRVELVSLGEAREQARQVFARVQLGADPQSERLAARARARQSVAGICRTYLEREGDSLSPRTVVEWRRVVEVEIAPSPIGGRPAAELTRSEVKQWSDRIQERTGHVAAHAFAVLRRVYSWAVGEDLLPGSPFVGLKPPAHPPSDARILTNRELRALMLALGDLTGAYPDVVRLLLLTLSRASMVTGMVRSEIEDLESLSPRWVVQPRIGLKRRGRVGGLPHVVPLSKPAVQILRARLAAIAPTEQEVFPVLAATGKGQRKHPTTAITSGFMRRLRRAVDVRYAADELGLALDAGDSRARQCEREKAISALAKGLVEPRPPWKVHHLRHTAATHLREDLGVDAEVVSLLLAHTRPARRGAAEITRIYDRSELLGPRRSALIAWAAWLESLAGEAGAAAPAATVLPHRSRA